MTDGIGRIYGGNNYGNYMTRNFKEEDANQQPEVPGAKNDAVETQLDPAKVMDFLAHNHLYIVTPEVTSTDGLDAATRERIAGYMENFDMIYGIIVHEFGEDLAPDVMDFAMDYLTAVVD